MLYFKASNGLFISLSIYKNEKQIFKLFRDHIIYVLITRN